MGEEAVAQRAFGLVLSLTLHAGLALGLVFVGSAATGPSEAPIPKFASGPAQQEATEVHFVATPRPRFRPRPRPERTPRLAARKPEAERADSESAIPDSGSQIPDVPEVEPPSPMRRARTTEPAPAEAMRPNLRFEISNPRPAHPAPPAPPDRPSGFERRERILRTLEVATTAALDQASELQRGLAALVEMTDERPAGPRADATAPAPSPLGSEILDQQPESPELAAQPTHAAVAAGGVESAEPTSEVRPVYPAASIRRGEEGLVVIEAHVSADGRVLVARVAESSSHVRLDRAAAQAVRAARFRPARRNGVNVASWVAVRIRFQLTDAGLF